MNKKIAIICGGGEAPAQVIKFCLRGRLPFIVVALNKYADSGMLCQISEGHSPESPTYWVELGEIGKVINILESNQIKDLLVIGSVKRPRWSDIKLDWQGKLWLAQFGLKALRGDDGLLRSIHAKLKELGFNLLNPRDFGLNDDNAEVEKGENHSVIDPSVRYRSSILGDNILVNSELGNNVLVKSEESIEGETSFRSDPELLPSAEDLRDIAYGIEVLKALSPLDVGQAVIVDEGRILGIEAAEGTQELIARCGGYRQSLRRGVSSGNGYDTRTDLPSNVPNRPIDDLPTNNSLNALSSKDLSINDLHNKLINQHINNSLTNPGDNFAKDSAKDCLSGVLVKMRKVNQDDRLDLPAIGPDTIIELKKNNFKGLAYEKGGAIIINYEKVVALANASGIFIHRFPSSS